MRHVVVLLTGVALIGGSGSAGADAPPPGATARCNDGTYSFSQHHSGTSHHGGVGVWLDASSSSSGAASSGATLRVAVGETVLLGARTRTVGCKLGVLPDRRCSPGAFYAGLTRAVICAPGFRTSAIRDVPQRKKYAVESEYGLQPAS